MSIINIIANGVGFIGDFLIVFAYFLLQLKKIKSEQLSYLLYNFFGAGCILFSLLFAWNLPVVVIEAVWMLISVYGIYKYLQNKQKNK